MWSRSSRRKVPMRLSQVALCAEPGWRCADSGAGGLKDSVKGLGEVLSAVADQELDVVELFAEVAACCTVHSSVGFAVTSVDAAAILTP